MKVCKLRKLIKSLIIAIKKDPMKRISENNFCSLFSFVFKFDKKNKSKKPLKINEGKNLNCKLGL